MHRAVLNRGCDVLKDAHVKQFQGEAVEVLACLHEAAEEPAFKLALAVLVLAKDRNEWRNYAERLVSRASSRNDEGEGAQP